MAQAEIVQHTRSERGHFAVFTQLFPYCSAPGKRSIGPMISGSDCMKDDKPPHICERCYREQTPAQEYVCERKGCRVTLDGQRVEDGNLWPVAGNSDV